jgi:hypothetical protein
MVKHQRRSHQRGIHSSELDDGETSDSDSGESPSTPQHPGHVQWPQTVSIPSHSHMVNGHTMHRAHSFADFGQHHLDGYSVHGPYGHRHSLSGSTHSYPQSIPEHGHPMLQNRAPSLPAHSSYYVPEQGNPGVATLNTNPTSIQTYHIPRHQTSQEILQSSPSSYSSVSRASPVSQEPYYTHQSAQAATYALHNSSPVEQQPMVQFQQQQISQHLSQQPMPHIQEQYQHPSSQSEGQWFDNVAYQQPVVEVISPVHNLQSYPQAIFHDPWGPKIEHFDDPSLQMPSARIENL